MGDVQCNPKLCYVKRTASIDVTRNGDNTRLEPAAQREPCADQQADHVTMLDAAISNKACHAASVRARASRYHSRLGTAKVGLEVSSEMPVSAFGVDRDPTISTLCRSLSRSCRAGRMAETGLLCCFRAHLPQAGCGPIFGSSGVAPDVPEARTTQPSSVRLIYYTIVLLGLNPAGYFILLFRAFFG